MLYIFIFGFPFLIIGLKKLGWINKFNKVFPPKPRIYDEIYYWDCSYGKTKYTMGMFI